MPKNTKGGKGYKKHKSGRTRIQSKETVLDITAGQGYFAIVDKLLGCNKVNVIKQGDTVPIQVTIPGRMYKRPGQWMKKGSTVLVRTMDDTIVKVIRDNETTYTNATNIAYDDDDIFGENDDEEEDEEEDKFRELTKPKHKQTNEGKGKRGEGKSFSTDHMFDTLDAIIENGDDINIDDI